MRNYGKHHHFYLDKIRALHQLLPNAKTLYRSFCLMPNQSITWQKLVFLPLPSVHFNKDVVQFQLPLPIKYFILYPFFRLWKLVTIVLSILLETRNKKANMYFRNIFTCGKFKECLHVTTRRPLYISTFSWAELKIYINWSFMLICQCQILSNPYCHLNSK